MSLKRISVVRISIRQVLPFAICLIPVILIVDVDVLFAFQFKSICSLFIVKGRLPSRRIFLRILVGDIEPFLI